MNNEAMKEVLNELFSHLERLETQSEAILQFLKEKKRVTDKQLAPYLEQAGNASNVKWRAARIRIEHLLSPEHLEKEVKLGKQPEIPKDSGEMKKTESRSTETQDQKPIEPDANQAPPAKSVDQERAAPAEALQTRPADGKAEKLDQKSESNQINKQQTAQDQHEESDSIHHPTEVTEPLARQEGAEPAAELNSEKKKGEQEAA